MPERPTLAAGPPEHGDLTVLYDELRRVWPRLTPAQRRAVNGRLRPVKRGGIVADAIHQADRDPVTGCQNAVGTGRFSPSLTPIARSQRAEMAVRIGVPQTMPVCVYTVNRDVRAYAGTGLWNDDNTDDPFHYDVRGEGYLNSLGFLDPPNICLIELYPSFNRLDAVNRLTIPGHEVYHCVTKDWRFRNGDPPAQPEWVEEGLATWAGHQVAPGTFQPDADAPGLYYKGWLEAEGHPWKVQGYRTFGLFSALDSGAGWTVLPSVWGAGDDAMRVINAWAGPGVDLALDSLGSGMARDPSLPPGWNQVTPFAVGLEEVPPPAPRAVVAGARVVSLVNPFVQRRIAVVPNPGRPLVQVTLEGPGRMTDGHQDWLHPSGVWVCHGGDCTCPAGKHPRVPIPPSTPVERLIVGTAAAGTPSRLRLSAFPMSEFCVRDAPPTVGPRPHGASFGDPHIDTVDGVEYDFQGAGEYVMVRGPGIEIQARTLGWPRTAATINEQIAMRVGRTRVAVLRDLQVRINGSPPRDAEPRAFDGGGELFRDSTCAGVGVRWPTGTTACVEGTVFLSLTVSVAPADAGKIRGLLGDADGNPDNDFVTRDGRVLPPQTAKRPAQLYGVFGPSWRVRRGETILAYGPGESWRTMSRRKGTPPRDAASQVPKVAEGAARKRCLAAGVTDPRPLDACAMDVALTRSPAFIASARRLQDRVASPAWTRVGDVLIASGQPVTVAADADGTATVVMLAGGGTPAVVRVGGDGTVAPAPLSPAPTSSIGAMAAATPAGSAVIASGSWPGGMVGTRLTRAGAQTTLLPASALLLSYVEHGGVSYLLTDGAGSSVTLWRGATAVPLNLGTCAARPSLGSDGADLRVVWMDWGCGDATRAGVRWADIDPATGALGSVHDVPLPPGMRTAAAVPVGLGIPLVARPGGGLWTAYLADDASRRHVVVYRLGAAAPSAVVPAATLDPQLSVGPDGSLWAEATRGGGWVLRVGRSPAGRADLRRVWRIALPEEFRGATALPTDHRIVAMGRQALVVSVARPGPGQPSVVWSTRVG